LIEGIKDGKAEGFKIDSPLITYDETGSYSPEVKAMLYGC
jgi:tRNA1(Val) A37 N6-methylase TrmN6